MSDRAEFCIVITTVSGKRRQEQSISGEKGAEALAAMILEQRLAACIQITQIKSMYIWEEKVCSEPEYLLLIKTTVRNFRALEDFITNNHPYECPEIIQIPIIDGAQGYLKWLGEQTDP